MLNKTYENNFTVAVSNALKKASFVEKCADLVKIFEQSPNKNIDQVYQLIVCEIFGISGRGWMLLVSPNCTTKHQQMEVDAVKDFLDPKGPFFKVIERLQNEPGCKYDVPACIAASSMFSFDKCMRLPAFELYFYCFAHCMMSSTQYGTQFTQQNSQSSIHNFLLCSYLEYFIPVDGSYPPVSNISIAPPPSAASSASQYSTGTPVKFASSMIKRISPKPHASQAATGNFSYQELWRSELLVRILADMWLVFPLHCNLPMREDLVKAVRILLIHLHSIRKKKGQEVCSNDSVMDQFLHNVRQFVQPKLFAFFVACFERWPLDCSFRAVTETWISFVQPWRYQPQEVKEEKGRKSEESRQLNSNKEVANKWFGFISKNIAFYNRLFYMALVRFMRTDLSVEGNSFLLMRATKVFAQPNLKQMVDEAESGPPAEQQDSMLMYRSASKENSKESFQDRSIQNMTSNETRILANQLIGVCRQALSTISKSQPQVKPPSSVGLFAWIEQFFGFEESQKGENSSSSKTARNLTCSINWMSEMFGIEVKKDNLEGSLGGGKESSSVYYKDGVLTEEGRYELMNNLKKVEVLPKCDPDLQPIRSDECAFLVRKMHQLSTLINNRYQDKLERVCGRDDCLGAVTRHYFTPAPTQGLSPFDKRVVRPRVSLRFLAHHRVSFYLVVLAVTCKVGGVSVTSLLFNLLVLIAFVVALNSLQICYKFKKQ